MIKNKKLLYFLLLCLSPLMISCGDDDDDDDNDDSPQVFTVNISANPSSIEEGDMAEVEVTLDQINQSGSGIQIDLNATGGTAQSGTDHTPIPSNVTISDGEQSASFTITAQDDTETEDDETIMIGIRIPALPPNVSDGSNTSVTLTIIDNDGSTNPPVANCPNDNSTDMNNFACTETPSASSMYTESVSGDVRTIMANGIPSHDYRNQIPMLVSSLNSQTQTYTIDVTPSLASTTTSITNAGSPVWVFGIALNGVKIDPAPAQPFVFENTQTMELNFDWVFEPNTNMEAVGLDCAVAHVQPDGQYHYHGNMGVYADQLQSGISTATTPPSNPIQIGWAGDGFPIFYRFGPDANGNMSLLEPSYRVKSGQRPGDGVSEPCGEYNGKYTNDYEFVNGLGDLDECNGIAQNVTIGGESFSYFYVITDEFPIISRCFSGTVDNSFRLGPG